MAVRKGYFEAHIKRFPQDLQNELKARLVCKNELEADERLQIPLRIWLAYLTPCDSRAEKCMAPALKNVWNLRKTLPETLPHPKIFLDSRKALRGASDLATLALLEILYGLTKEHVSLPETRYREWLLVADRFGLWKLRYALEDAIFKAFDPENYALFESVVEKQMFIDTRLISSIHAILKDALARAGLKNFAIKNRRKNIYGVYKKVALKRKSINDIYDIHGFRILMSSEKDCHKAVEVLHRLWRHFPERYKDYIASPKENGYQSIHTVLNSLERKTIEFQVRTYEMDVVAASGPANHAEYKKSSRNTTSGQPF